MTALTPGEVILGKYRVERVLGAGGMGIVVAARHLALDQRVAIEILQPSLLARPEIVERFAREARAAAKLESDHAARVLDVGAFADGTPFMVLEYLEGGDLSSVRRGGVGLPVATAVGYALEACEAIAEAHRVGIVHRDLKPANLFLARRADGKVRVKVLDFGISKVAGASEASVTSTTTVMGSAEYMSPEQMLSTRDADARADVWALGVTLYELLTATVPFPGESITQVCALVMTTTPAPPSSRRPEIGPALDAVIMKCLARDRADRHPTALALAAALRPFAQPERASAPTDPLYAVTMRAPTASSASVAPAPPTAVLDAGVAERTSVLPVAAGASTRGGSTTAVVSSDLPSTPLARTSSRSWLVGGAVLATVLAAGIALSRPSGGERAAASAAATDGAAVPPPSAPTADATATADVLDEAPVVAPATAEAEVVPPPAEATASARSSAKTPRSVRPARERRATPPRASASATAAAMPPASPAKASCSPPYTFDANGRKHIKPGCD